LLATWRKGYLRTVGYRRHAATARPRCVASQRRAVTGN
jgi:hypothetical protein